VEAWSIDVNSSNSTGLAIVSMPERALLGSIESREGSGAVAPELNLSEIPNASLADEVVPHSPWRLTAVETLPEFRLRVKFADGLTGVVNLSGIVHSPGAGVFSALADPALFAQVRIEHGTPVWPGEVDLAPDAMHTAIQANGEWSL